MNPYRPVIVLGAWIAGLLAAIAVLTATGTGSLALPAMNIEAWNAWLQETSGLYVFFSLLRLIALVGAWYLLVTTVLSTVSQWLASASLQAVSDVVTAPPVQRMTKRAVSLSIAGAIALPSSAAMLALPSPAAAAAASSAAASTDAPMLRNVTSPSSSVATPTPPAPKADGPRPVPAPGPMPAPSQAAPGAPAAPKVWTVKPGQNMWAAAELVLTSEWGFKPTDAEIAPYWKQLMERNRDALAKANNPNIIYPDQAFELPPVPAPQR